MTRRGKRADARTQPPPHEEVDPEQRDAAFAQARTLVTDQVLPALDDFRTYMAAQNRKLEVVPYLDHIEGPQVVVHISRADGRITATFVAEVTADGVRPFWDVRSTGRVKTHWVEQIPGGTNGVTQDHVLTRLTELYNTDFS
jgi:hypothetical protein